MKTEANTESDLEEDPDPDDDQEAEAEQDQEGDQSEEPEKEDDDDVLDDGIAEQGWSAEHGSRGDSEEPGGSEPPCQPLTGSKGAHSPDAVSYTHLTLPTTPYV